VKVFFDTSVLVAALVREHPRHEPAFDRLRRTCSGPDTMLTSGHTLAELFAVLTTLPVSPRIAPGAAARLIGESVETHAEIVTLAPADYRETVRRLGDLGLSGGIIYDALACCAAVRAKADLILTFNTKDFRRAWPEVEASVEEP
jgi:predicted nucleic acid-binding protein